MEQSPVSRPDPVVEVTREDAVFRVGPGDDFDRRTPLAARTLLRVKGKDGRWLRVDLGGGQEGWVQSQDVREAKGAVASQRLRNVLVRAVGDETWVDLQLTGRVAFDVLDAPDEAVYRIRLYNTTLMMHELMQLGAEPRVRFSGVRQSAREVADLEVRVAGRGLWGWSATYGPLSASRLDPPGHNFAAIAPEVLRIRIRHAPPILASASRSLQGLTVVVDAGHGGEDPGATGLNGLVEKDVNIAVARALRAALVGQGARVVMTREADETVGDSAHDLERRVTMAREGNGHIFVSIHHNARARVEDGRVARGVYVYYYRPQSAELARTLVAPLARALGEEYMGHVWRSFHVTRQTFMPSVLVEVAFLSNPQEEAKMRDPGYAARVAEGLLRGIEAFVKAGQQP